MVEPEAVNFVVDGSIPSLSSKKVSAVQIPLYTISSIRYSSTNSMTKEFKVSELSSQQLEDLLCNLGLQVEKTHQEWAEARAIHENLFLFNKSMFYSAMPFSTKETKYTEEEKKRHAYISEKYNEHVRGQASAFSTMVKAEAGYKSSVVKHETIKSILLKRFGS